MIINLDAVILAVVCLVILVALIPGESDNDDDDLTSA